MRLEIVTAAALALAPALAAAHPAPGHPQPHHPAGAAESSEEWLPIVREADGSVTIREVLPAFPALVDADAGAPFWRSHTDPVAPDRNGRRRSPAEQAIDEDLERAFEEAVDMARFGRPN